MFDNGQVWVKDNYNIDLFGESELSQNDSGFILIFMMKRKKVKSVLVMEAIPAIYVLCESPEQKLFYHSEMPQRETEEKEDEINNTLPKDHISPLKINQ